MSDLPLHGTSDTPETLLEPEPQPARTALAEALSDDSAAQPARLRAVAGQYPTFLEAWARLAEWELEHGDAVTAYAYARTGYHRGLDKLRQSGWRGQGPVPWRHEPNRGFLLALRALMRAADAIGEEAEADRCRTFLSDLDPEHGPG